MSIKGYSRSMLEVISGHMALKWQRRPSGLYCFNYHRIGRAADSEFDPNVFSCSEERFAQHLAFYKQEFDVVSIEDLIRLQSENRKIKERLALITFDDGYIDNYLIAYPILKAAGVFASFFVSTDYIDKPEIPWWDEVGWIVRHAGARSIQLPHWPQPINVAHGSISARVRRLLKAVKQDNSLVMSEKLAQLKRLLQLENVSMPKSTELFMNWAQLKEMADHGMHIGSHTLSHNILSHLTAQQQLVELTQSKQRLDTMLERPAISLAYPVGGHNSFTPETQRLVQQAGYQLAFSFVSGINRELNVSNCFQLRRFPIEEESSVWRLKQMVNRRFDLWAVN